MNSHPLPLLWAPRLVATSPFIWKQLLSSANTLPPPPTLAREPGGGTYFIHSSLRQTRHWSTTSTDRFWLLSAASILFRMVGPTGNRVGTKQGECYTVGDRQPQHPSPHSCSGEAAPTSVCSHWTPTGHYKLILAEGLVILIAGGVDAGASGHVDLYDNSKFCEHSTHAL